MKTVFASHLDVSDLLSFNLEMSIPSYGMLILSTLLLLIGILEHSQIDARYLMVPKKFLANLKLGGEHNNEEIGEVDQSKHVNFPSPDSVYSRFLNKRGPEVFIPFMEVWVPDVPIVAHQSKLTNV